MHPISTHIHEFDFSSSEFLRENKSHLLDLYKKVKSDPNHPHNDVALIDTYLNFEFNDRIKELIEKYYIVEPTKYDISFNLYVQNKEKSVNYWHNHIHSPMTICGVMYLDVPKEGGEIQFMHYPDYGEKNPLIVKPKEDKIYIFPSWLYHKPMPQKSNIERICINFGYISNSRPIVKNWGILW
jgi:hypothetical protein